MSAERDGAKDLGDELYERYAKPLEAAHWGEYIAIMPDGRTVLGATVDEVVRRALDTFGRGSFVFKLGPRIVWKLR